MTNLSVANSIDILSLFNVKCSVISVIKTYVGYITRPDALIRRRTSRHTPAQRCLPPNFSNIDCTSFLKVRTKEHYFINTLTHLADTNVSLQHSISCQSRTTGSWCEITPQHMLPPPPQSLLQVSSWPAFPLLGFYLVTATVKFKLTAFYLFSWTQELAKDNSC